MTATVRALGRSTHLCQYSLGSLIMGLSGTGEQGVCYQSWATRDRGNMKSATVRSVRTPSHEIVREQETDSGPWGHELP